MAANLAEIAAQAKVSAATVSRVLNGRPGVSPATKQAVLTALDVLGYERPKLLRSRRAGLIGLIVPELSNPIFPTYAQVIETALVTRGYVSVLCTQEPGGTTEDEYTELLLERAVSGIIFVNGLHADSRSDPARYQKLVAQGLPIVMINGPAREVDASFFSADDELGLELAVAHLSALGHRRIGLALGQERFVTSIRKKRGFLRAMDGVEGGRAAVEHTMYTVEGGRTAAARLLDRGCTAICCGGDPMAIGAIRAVRERGLSVPDDVSVIGSDDSSLMAYIDPPLTTIRQPVRELSMAAVTALLDEMNGFETPHGEFLFRPELVVRSSSGRPREQ
ncbi:LacI family DNA-binding transcriptional regulator [Allonocardiopsis opalescens]|uniref:LacI family transcriptional regulator n=1 Tax=Allonocardiopsis opalescens TaxID=1144618 RepID=A0A2T0Q1X9_9ACTN|nr:LacI family DNA-binding transcriptional regulator [Allonocardiopsis opalescens]PRX97812.1 LacI family transcriptional regulator [Allonocardiopsis opalescens]